MNKALPNLNQKPDKEFTYKRSSHKEPDSSKPVLFEVAWEVCNQLGGIYTVIKSKAPAMADIWGENYFLLGPYFSESAEIEFEQADYKTYAPGNFLSNALDELRALGLPFYFGHWLIPGKPKVILLDFRSRYPRLDEDKYYLWKDNLIPTPGTDWEVNDTIAFGFLAAEFFRVIGMHLAKQKAVVHVHEWMAGVLLPRLKTAGSPFSTVFTTHATLLGRYIASDDPNFYSHLQSINPEQSANHYNIYSRYAIEKSAAHSADVFTTISEVTAREAKKFLSREADLILPNGLNVQRFTAMHEFQNLHLKFKERINEFVMGHFFPSYTFDLDRTLYIFTSGRYEYRNKGMDLFIEAIYRLNMMLKDQEDPPNIVAFIITKAPVKNVNVAALQRHLSFEDLKNSCIEIEKGIGQRILASVSRGKLPLYEELLSNDYQVRLKRTIHGLKNSKLPAIVTHDMQYDAEDAVLQHLRHRRLFNEPGDPVKVVFHPEFVTATSPFFNMDYDQFVRGCHLGVFPSYYEPWGYTPPECLASGIPTVTTDLSGFGSYVEKNIPDAADQGIYVLNRAKQSNDRAIEDLAAYLFRFSGMTRRERIELRNKAERLSDRFDWSVLAEHYYTAQQEAIRKSARGLL
jgi:glycogen(starch) synthase